MAASSSILPALRVNIDTFSGPSMIIVHNKEEEKAFLAGCCHALYRCKVWLDGTHDITNDLPMLLDPDRPCIRIHPWYLDLGLRFPLSSLLKEILIFYHIGLYNLTSYSIHIITCFELLNS
ncbi:hypothetical protein C1H46_029492 [Malus baccata]|uniref:Uncharacterized protein n=1 Tax=Malus baccata TaxID=106549 RepID=A0A540LER6_MALBA|nr:hypothetical protein C1H46_029492 [Malus baccata]